MSTLVRVADGIYRIDVGQRRTAATGEPISCSLVYLIVSGREAAIIDTGPGIVTPEVVAAIRSIDRDPARLSSIILTHIHLDHAGGAGHMAKQFPTVKVSAHKRGASHLINPGKLIEGTREAYGDRFEDDYGPILPIPEKQVMALEDNEIIKVGSRELRILYTPGHASHHIAVYDDASRSVFSGDALGFLHTGRNAIIIVAGFDLELALQSIDRIAYLKPRQVFAAHGTAKREASEFIESVRQTTKDYGDIILEAMRQGRNGAEMSRRLLAYHRKHSPADNRTERGLDEIIPWYIAYFKKKGTGQSQLF